MTTLEDAKGYPGRPGRGPGWSLRSPPLPQEDPVLGPAGGHLRGAHRIRGVRQLGRLRQQELLRRRLAAPRPDLAVLLPLSHRPAACPGSHPSTVITWWNITPALLILIFPLGFRMTCYYYRKAYYRSFWLSPPACAVSDGHGSYTGESRFPLLLQNVHRYFFYFGLIFNVILTIDAVEAFRQPGIGIGFSVGTAVLCINAVLLWLYSLSCHACRHLCGGGVKQFSRSPIRHRIWKALTPLNGKHMLFAWMSLVFVAFSDLYVRLVASGTIHDYGFHF